MSRAALAATCLAAALLTACGSGDGGGGGGGRVVVETTDPSKDKVSMTAPSSVEAGLVRITLRNRGDTLHDAQLFRIDGEHTATDLNYGLLEKVDSAAKPKWAHPEGGVAPLRPGENATVTQVLEPGRYFIADTQERETAVGGKSVNAVKGGIAELEVTGEGGGELPAVDDGRPVQHIGSAYGNPLRASRNRARSRTCRPPPSRASTRRKS